MTAIKIESVEERLRRQLLEKSEHLLIALSMIDAQKEEIRILRKAFGKLSKIVVDL
jgi:hypothetical protein